MPDTNSEFSRFQIFGLLPVETYCEINPTGCCNSQCNNEAPPSDGRPIVGWCVEYTVLEVAVADLEKLYSYCVPHAVDCCPGSSSSSGSGGNSLNDDGQGHGGDVSGTVIGFNVQKTIMQLPPGAKILGKYCVFNPINCCTPTTNVSSSASFGSTASGFPDPPDPPTPTPICIEVGTYLTSMCGTCYSPMSSIYGVILDTSRGDVTRFCCEPENELLYMQYSSDCQWPLLYGPASILCNTLSTSTILRYGQKNFTGEPGWNFDLFVIFPNGATGLLASWWKSVDDWNCFGNNVFTSADLVYSGPTICTLSFLRVYVIPLANCSEPPPPFYPRIPNNPDCLYQPCTGDFATSKCTNQLLGYSGTVSFAGVQEYDPQLCQNCDRFNLYTPADPLIIPLPGRCGWFDEFPSLPCYRVGLYAYFNAFDTRYPLGSWLLMMRDQCFSNIVVLLWAIPDEEWNCNGCNVYTPEHLVYELNPQTPYNLCDPGNPCDWSAATITVCSSQPFCTGSSSSSSSSSSSAAAPLPPVTVPCCTNPIPAILFMTMVNGIPGSCPFFEAGVQLTYGTYVPSVDPPVTGWYISHTYSSGVEVAMVLSCSGFPGIGEFSLNFYCNGVKSAINYTQGVFPNTCSPFFVKFQNASGQGQSCVNPTPDCLLVAGSTFTVTE